MTDNALRLVVHLFGSRLRFPLEPGENLVGSQLECAIRLRHPSVSRRHAVLRLDNGRVEVEDLGSRNGTHHRGHKVRTATLGASDELRFGAVEAFLEEIPAADLETGILLPSHRDRSTHGGDGDATTLSSGLADAFALQHLPEIAERLASGADNQELAEQVGHALSRATPALGITVSIANVTGEQGVLFAAHHDPSDDDSSKVIEVSAEATGFRIAAQFPSPQIAAAHEPLLAAGARLIAAADRRSPRPTAAARFPAEPPPLPDPPTVSPQMLAIYTSAAKVARGDIGVLIMGESGTGKEVLAQYIHQASPVSDGPLLSLNCAALPRDLLEAELFGVERGVATGIEARPGKFELADGGTLFLDEIGDMAPDTQARILRVLQSGEVYRIGGRQAKQVRIRFLAATNRDITAMIADGSFRADLYHRIAGWVVELPPLRQRRADIPNLAAHFLARAGDRAGVRVRGVSRQALDALTGYPWPGNVRELETEMGRAVLFLEDGELLDSGRLSTHLQQAASKTGGSSLAEQLESAEREVISRTLRETTSADEAARQLGISRATLYRRLKALGIERDSG